MGFDLFGRDDDFHFNTYCWWFAVTLAVGCGWEPMGTGAPRGVPAREWSGGYFTNDGQRLYVRDARRLAEVLTKILSATDKTSLDFQPKRARAWLRANSGGFVPLGEMWAYIRRIETFRHPPRRTVKRSRPLPGPWLLVDKEGRTCLRDFAAFCRRGNIRIY
jgi:hypothetical protein